MSEKEPEKYFMQWSLEPIIYEKMSEKAKQLGIEIDEFIVVACSIITEAFNDIPREVFEKHITNLYPTKYGPVEVAKK